MNKNEIKKINLVMKLTRLPLSEVKKFVEEGKYFFASHTLDNFTKGVLAGKISMGLTYRDKDVLEAIELAPELFSSRKL